KWIKQHLRIKKFIGTSENAVKTQIWCAVATYVLIAIIKKELQIDASLYEILQILSVSLFEKTELSCAFQGDWCFQNQADSSNQLMLFNL
ncbi:transposase, IS4 family protein, partial [mine drainage metagenome]